MKRIKLAIQENMKRIIIIGHSNFISDFPENSTKIVLLENNRAGPKERTGSNVQKKQREKKDRPLALPSYNLYFLPLMTGQTDLTNVAVVYVLGLLRVLYRWIPVVILELIHVTRNIFF